MLALLCQQIVDVRIHPVVGITHRGAPERLALGRQRSRLALHLVHGREVADEIAEQMDDAARIFLAEAAEHPIGAARIEREDRLEVRGLLLGDVQLLGAEARDADHADIAVAPGLRRDPFDQVVAVEDARAAAFRLADAARHADDVHVAARNEEARVAGLHRAGPQRRPGRLRRDRVRHLGALEILVVDRERQECWKLFTRVGPVDVDRELDAVAHRHRDVLLADHRVIGRRPVVVRRRPVRELQGIQCRI